MPTNPPAGPAEPTPLPRPRCPEPDGAVCRFNLWGRCCHARNDLGACPLKLIALGRRPYLGRGGEPSGQ